MRTHHCSAICAVLCMLAADMHCNASIVSWQTSAPPTEALQMVQARSAHAMPSHQSANSPAAPITRTRHRSAHLWCTSHVADKHCNGSIVSWQTSAPLTEALPMVQAGSAHAMPSHQSANSPAAHITRTRHRGAICGVQGLQRTCTAMPALFYCKPHRKSKAPLTEALQMVQGVHMQ